MNGRKFHEKIPRNFFFPIHSDGIKPVANMTTDWHVQMWESDAYLVH